MEVFRAVRKTSETLRVGGLTGLNPPVPEGLQSPDPGSAYPKVGIAVLPGKGCLPAPALCVTIRPMAVDHPPKARKRKAASAEPVPSSDAIIEPVRPKGPVAPPKTSKLIIRLGKWVDSGKGPGAGLSEAERTAVARAIADDAVDEAILDLRRGPPLAEVLATNLRVARAERRLSQRDLAKIADISANRISLIEQGADCLLSTVETLARCLDYTPAELLTPRTPRL